MIQRPQTFTYQGREITTLCRYARADQYPAGTDLRQKARDSVIRYCAHFGLRFRWLHDQGGMIYRIPERLRGVRNIPASEIPLADTVDCWRSEVEIIS